MFATNLASKDCNFIKSCSISKALFITIAPPPCSKLLSAACSFRINILRPSNPFKYPRLAALDTLSLRTLSDGFLNNASGRDNDSETWNGRLNFYWDGGSGTKATLGASFTTHELGAQPLVLRNGGDFYDRSVDFDESTEIDQNQQFLRTLPHHG